MLRAMQPNVIANEMSVFWAASAMPRIYYDVKTTHAAKPQQQT
jgi:hypothetical protein